MEVLCRHLWRYRMRMEASASGLLAVKRNTWKQGKKFAASRGTLHFNNIPTNVVAISEDELSSCLCPFSWFILLFGCVVRWSHSV